jgi:hypothetical protein
MRNPPASARTNASVVATSGTAKAQVRRRPVHRVAENIELMANTAAEEKPF